VKSPICWKFAGRLLDHVNTPLVLLPSAKGPSLAMTALTLRVDKAVKKQLPWRIEIKISSSNNYDSVKKIKCCNKLRLERKTNKNFFILCILVTKQK